MDILIDPVVAQRRLLVQGNQRAYKGTTQVNRLIDSILRSAFWSAHHTRQLTQTPVQYKPYSSALVMVKDQNDGTCERRTD
jgi:hypothetical protein